MKNNLDTNRNTAADIPAGTVIAGRYRIEAPVGNGGNATVYRVYDLRLDKIWALKTVRAMTQGELEALKRVSHPALPGIADLISYEGQTGLIMDYVSGQTLGEYCASHTVSIGTLYEWMREIAVALAYLHSITPAILYMDCKPSNIILGTDGHLHLVDMGSAYICGYRHEGSLSGTLPYAAPEQRIGGGVDARSDIYALGMTIMRLGGISAHRYSLREHIYYRLFRHDRFSALSRITGRCTQPDPDRRYQSAEELIYQLDHPDAIGYTLPSLKQLAGRLADIIYKNIVAAFSVLSFHMYADNGRLPYLLLGLTLFLLLIALSVRYGSYNGDSCRTWQCNRDIILGEVSGALMLAVLCVMLTKQSSYAEPVHTDTPYPVTDRAPADDTKLPSVTIYDENGHRVLYKGQYVVRKGDNLYLYIPSESLSDAHIPARIEVQ